MNEELLNHRINVIIDGHNRRMNEIKREGARQRAFLCLLMALMMAGIGWYNFSISNVVLGWVFAFATLSFIATLVLGAIFDRPTH